MSSWPSSASSITTWVTSNSAPTTLSQSPQAFFILLAAIVICGWSVSASSRYPRWRRGCGIGWLVSYVTWARDLRHVLTYRKSRAFVSYVTWPRALRYELLTLISSLAGGHGGPSGGGWRSGRGHDSSSQGGKRLSAMDVGGGHQALLPRISPLGTPIYSLWSNRANLWHVDVYQKYNHFVNFFHRIAF